MIFDCMVHNKVDNVGVILHEVKVGNTICVKCLEDGLTFSLIANSDVAANFKISLSEIDTGENVVEYGEIIGVATKPISLGELVHIHNIKSLKL